MVKGAAANLIRVEMFNRHNNVQKLPFWGTSYGDSSESVVSAMLDSFGWRALRHGISELLQLTAIQGHRMPKGANTPSSKCS
jgi:hypothetical protein